MLYCYLLQCNTVVATWCTMRLSERESCMCAFAYTLTDFKPRCTIESESDVYRYSNKPAEGYDHATGRRKNGEPD